MYGVNHIVKTAKDYVKKIYPHPIPKIQEEESEQHFLMGVWTGLQLARQMNADQIKNLEGEIKEYQLKRVKELEEKSNPEVNRG